VATLDRSHNNLRNGRRVRLAGRPSWGPSRAVMFVASGRGSNHLCHIPVIVAECMSYEGDTLVPLDQNISRVVSEPPLSPLEPQL
jgi:hypothetical protein